MTRTLIIGASGMVGSALERRLPNACAITRNECDLLDQHEVMRIIRYHQPHQLYLAAAMVGGIAANDLNPVDFLENNLRIQLNVLSAAHAAGTNRLLFLGSSCIYPRMAPQPLKPEYLMTGPLEPTNSAYAMAKLAGIEQVRAYRKQYGRKWIVAIPTNLYGPGDNYHPERSHVVAALIRKFVEAKAQGLSSVSVWGTGKARRELMHVDDCAADLVHLMDTYDGDEPVNVGSGQEVTIAELASMIADVVGYEGLITFDPSRPDGTPRKVLESYLQRDRIPLRQGLQQTIAAYL